MNNGFIISVFVIFFWIKIQIWIVRIRLWIEYLDTNQISDGYKYEYIYISDINVLMNCENNITLTQINHK
jgi:hypothetical protein